MDLINWELAKKAASRFSNRASTPLDYNATAMQECFEDLTPKAEKLVNKATGLPSTKSARSKVLSRQDWIEANLKSFSRLLRPLENRLAGKSNKASQNIGGVQIGIILGWMSTRVLGQYDLLIVEDEEPEAQDMVYFVGPNISAIEWRHGFIEKDFRLWIALHELTHRAQFTGVSWLRQHFLALVEQSLDNIELDKEGLSEALKNIVSAIKSQGRSQDGEQNNSLPYLIGNDEQIEIYETMGGMMSLLEGHGEVMMDKAAENQIKELERFHRVIRNRRKNINVFQKLLGIDTKLRQYEAGENFVKELQLKGGDTLLNQAWEQPQNLPSMEEINNPSLWIERIENIESKKEKGEETEKGHKKEHAGATS